MASVQNYNLLGNMVSSLVLSDCNVPRKVLIQVDDSPAVAPKDSSWCEKFSMKYKSGVGFGEVLPNFDKAFDCSKFGKVLGIDISTSNRIRYRFRKKLFETMQGLVGKLNHISPICPFLNSFKYLLNMALTDCLIERSAILPYQAISNTRFGQFLE
jgi:hypothetical protein